MLKYGNLTSLGDEELCRLAREGNRDAENVLAERYFYIVRAAARSYYLAGGDQEDLIQEGMLGLVSAIREFDPARGGFSAFAQRCVRNRMISVERAAARIKQLPLRDYLPLGDVAEDGGLPAGHASDPAEMLLERESYLERLREFRAALSRFEAKVLDLYLEGLATAEIAERLSKPGKSIDNAIGRIRRKLLRLTEQGSNG